MQIGHCSSVINTPFHIKYHYDSGKHVTMCYSKQRMAFKCQVVTTLKVSNGQCRVLKYNKAQVTLQSCLFTHRCVGK